MATWLGRLMRWLYGVRDNPVDECDVVIPLCYALTVDDELPDAEVLVLHATYRLWLAHGTRIAWASAQYLFPRSDAKEDEEKLALLRALGYVGDPIIGDGITNSVTEAWSIRDALKDTKVNPRTIVVIADWPHARSARHIYRRVFPKARILMRSVEGQWKKNHRVLLQRSGAIWFLACVARHLALVVFGLKRVAKIQHPVHKR